MQVERVSDNVGVSSKCAYADLRLIYNRPRLLLRDSEFSLTQ